MEDGEEAARRGEGRQDAPEPPGREGTGSSDPPGGAGGPGEPGADAGGGADEDEGLSTAAKVGLGCGGCLLVVVAVVGIVVALGGGWLSRQVEDLAGTAERQAEATETLDRLRRDHAFRPPEDGAVDRDRARRFFGVTDAAWREMRDWAAELEELGRELEDREARLTDVGALMEGYDKLAESRVVLARALEEHDMPLAEYLWTGNALRRAHGAVEEGAVGEEVPAATRSVIREHEREMEELVGDADQPGKQMVLFFAAAWGSAEEGLQGMPGLDTLLAR